MSYLMVLSFPSEKGAEMVRDDVIRLQKEHIVKLEDAAVVVRRKDGKVKIKQATVLSARGL